MGLVQIDTLQVGGQSLTGLPLFGLCAVGLNAADAPFAARREQLQFITHPDLARQQRTGHHRPETGHGEDPVNRQTETPFPALFVRPLRQPAQFGPEFIKTFAVA